VDWRRWHEDYDDPSSSLSARLRVVEERLTVALDEAPPGDVAIVSLCAGDGRDVASVLSRHARRGDAVGRLVDLDEELVRAARANLEAAGVTRVRAVVGDAGSRGALEGLGPLDLVVACGIFGNVAMHDVATTVAALAQLVAVGGDVVWTRHRGAPDVTGEIRALFADAGFEEVRFVAVEGTLAGVGHHRLAVRPHAAPVPDRLFRFVGDGADARR